MNAGQMLRDVQLAAQGRVPVGFYGRLGGMVPLPDEVLDEIMKIHKPEQSANGKLPHKQWLDEMIERFGTGSHETEGK